MTNTAGVGPIEPSAEQYGIGRISGEPPHIKVDILKEFDKATYERYSTALSNALAPTDRFTAALVHKNFQSYINTQKFVGRLIGLGQQFSNPDRMGLAEVIMGQIVNWLTSFRLFLDHSETILKRRFGDESPQVGRFKHQTAEAFDNDIGYRFTYGFRNYVQHCGRPLSALEIGRAKPTAEATILQQASFLLNRDRLLEDFDWHRIVREDLKAMDETFPLQPLAETAMDCIRKIDSLVIEMAIEEGARTIGDLREAASLLPEGIEGVLNLFRFEADDDGVPITISPSPFSTDLVEQYESVASGAKKPSDFHQPPVLKLPIFDPSTLGQRIQADSRAVQAMTLWQSQGGSTPAFHASVRAIVEEDGGVEPLLTGMFTMSAVLIHMVAAAIGVDPAGLLGGLLDIYALDDGTPKRDHGPE